QNGLGILKSTDKGATYSSITKPAGQTTGVGEMPFLMDPNNHNKIYIGYIDLFRSDNQGGSWTNISNGHIGPGTGYNYNCYSVSIAPSNSNVIYISKLSALGRLYVTTNGGTNWDSVSAPVALAIHKIVIHPTDPQNIWIIAGYLSDRMIFHSTNGGANW